MWDDAAFRARVKQLASARGVSVGDAMRAIDIDPTYLKNRAYLKTQGKGRNVAHVLRIAMYFEIDPAWLLGFGAAPEGITEGSVDGE